MKLKELLSDYWEIFFSFATALVVAYDGAVRFLQLGWITNERVSSACTILFVVFGCFAILKFVRKARKAEQSAANAVEKMEIAERQFKELQIAYTNQQKQLEAIKIDIGTANKSLLGNQISNSTINIGDSEKEQNTEQETRFPRTYFHREFHIKKDSAQNVLNFIRSDTSSSLWCIMDGDKISYSVDYQESEFRYPGKDNTPVHGAFFSVIKDGKHFQKWFWISIISSGIGENTLLTINFETQEKDAVDFFGVLKRKLVKHFTIWEPGIAGAWR